LSKDLGRVFGLENFSVDAAKLKENQKYIEDFYDNVEGSGQKLQEIFAEEIWEGKKLDIIANVEGGEEAKANVANLLDSLKTIIDNSDFKVGISLDPEANKEFFDSCNQLIAAAGWTKEEAQKQFKDMGFDVTVKDVDITKTTKSNYSYYKLDE
jgi:hypothetical protein